MSDGFSVRVNSANFERELNTMTRNVDAATRDALRDMGRGLAAGARRRARVYRGKPRSWSVDGAKRGRVIPGELKRSISGYSQVRGTADKGYRVKVGPRGGHVHLYAQKIEKLDHYMEEAAAEIRPQARPIVEKNVERATRSGRRR